MKAYLHELAARRAQGYKEAGYKVPESMVPKGTGKPADKAKAAGSVKVRRKSDGAVKQVTPEQAEAILKSPGYERAD